MNKTLEDLDQKEASEYIHQISCQNQVIETLVNDYGIKRSIAAQLVCNVSEGEVKHLIIDYGVMP
jgi:hypothetical protein